MSELKKLKPSIVKVICKVVVANAHGQVLVLRRSKTAPKRALQWDLPGGVWYGDMTFEDCVRRESMEETGMELHNLILVSATPEVQQNGEIKLFVSYRARAHNNIVTLSMEHDDYAWIGPMDSAEYELPLVWAAVLQNVLDQTH